MSKFLRKVGLVVAFLVIFEGFIFVRWMFFSGSEPSLHDLDTGLGILAAIWLMTKVGAWFDQREAHHKEIVMRIRDMDAHIETLYKWGGLQFSGDAEKDSDDWEWELDGATKAKITECREAIERGDTSYRYNLGVIFWNRAMDSYNGHSKDGYREAVRWLRKAASVDYDCESTLGDAYIELQDYDEAMYWYRRSLKRGRRLSWIAESKIADMYAKGHGVSKNHAEAARWWEKAAQHGSDWSRYQLGELYSEGADGFEKDNRKAYFHLYIASSADGQYSPRTSAIELREKVEKELGDYWVTQEKKRADEWLTAMKEITCQESKNRVKPLPLPD
jgi:tetratricopeptide (TPR) repeat protein